MSIDSDFDTKWLAYVQGPLRLQLPRMTRVDEFGFTTASDQPSRDPIQWTVRGSLDGGNWTLLHEQDMDYDTPLSRKTASNPFPLAQVSGHDFDSTTTTQHAEPHEIVAVEDDSSSSLNTREQVIGGAVGGSVGAVAVGLLGGLLGGLLTTVPPTTTLLFNWPVESTHTTTTAPGKQTSMIEVTFVSGEPTPGPRFLGHGDPADAAASAGIFQRHLSSAQPWMWAAVALAALSLAVCMLVGFQAKGRAKPGRKGQSSRSAIIEDSAEHETDEESSLASLSLIKNEMTGSQTTPARHPDAFDVIDQNHDGVITRAEFEAARRFEMIDQNHDGVISREEWEAAARRHSVMQMGPVAPAYVPVPQPVPSSHMQMVPLPQNVPVASVQMPPGMFAPLPLQPMPPMPPPVPLARIGSPRASAVYAFPHQALR